MRTTNERMAAVQMRVNEIKRKKSGLKSRMIALSSVVACLALIIGTAFTLPGVMSNLADNSTAYVGPAASMFASGEALGYIVIGLLAFTLGVCVTLLCYRIRQRNKRENGDD